MKIFLKMVRQNIWTTVLFCAFAGIFAAVFSLYSLETEAVLYASLLCLVLGAIVTAVRYIRFRAEYEKRQRLIQNIELLNEHLPEAVTPEQKQWVDMIEKLNELCRQAQSRLKGERTEMLDYFTVWVHQIKIPISVMHMELENASGDEVRGLSEQLFRIEQYVEMVLCYFRLDGSAADLVSEKVQVDEVIRAGIRKYAPLFISKRIGISYSGTGLSAVTDSKWLGFITEQLLSNAVKYTERGKVTISVTDDRCITVSDTGIGIAEEDLPRIFERGYTGFNGRAEHKSTGLGLYLAGKACKKLGIEISVESRVGEGSSFTLKLPEKLKAE